MGPDLSVPYTSKVVRHSEQRPPGRIMIADCPPSSRSSLSSLSSDSPSPTISPRKPRRFSKKIVLTSDEESEESVELQKDSEGNESDVFGTEVDNPGVEEKSSVKWVGIGSDEDDDESELESVDTNPSLADLCDNGTIRSLDDELASGEDAVVKGFKEGYKLLHHQAIGRRWMQRREDPVTEKTGGILADDMGLGKTIQILARIAEGEASKDDLEAGWAGATLVVCPLALVRQWALEVQRITEHLVTTTHQSSTRTSDPEVLQTANIVITTYDVIRAEYNAFQASSSRGANARRSQVGSDSDEESFSSNKHPRVKSKKDALFRVKWFRIVLDEAHTIKNWKTKSAIACCALEANFRWALTGTPMQNDVTELFSLFKFLRISPIGSWECFNDRIAKPIQNGQGVSRAMRRLQTVLQQIMLRRLKDDTLNGEPLVKLPARNLHVVSCHFSPFELQFYNRLKARMEHAKDRLIAVAADSGKSANYMTVRLMLLRLRQACDHPSLVIGDYRDDLQGSHSTGSKEISDEVIDEDNLVGAFKNLTATPRCTICGTHNVPEKNGANTICLDCSPLANLIRQQNHGRLGTSAKIRKILELLAQVEKNSQGRDKTIIFSQFISMLDLIQSFLTPEGINFVRYDGAMKLQEREKAIEAMNANDKVKVILISFKAGSTGLNLTACNNVILVDLWWNPALEDQAFDRAHRLGQTKDVNIYKLKIDGTVEERILELQETKRNLTLTALSGEDKSQDVHLGVTELLGLFRSYEED